MMRSIALMLSKRMGIMHLRPREGAKPMQRWSEGGSWRVVRGVHLVLIVSCGQRV